MSLQGVKSAHEFGHILRGGTQFQTSGSWACSAAFSSSRINLACLHEGRCKFHMPMGGGRRDSKGIVPVPLFSSFFSAGWRFSSSDWLDPWVFFRQSHQRRPSAGSASSWPMPRPSNTPAIRRASAAPCGRSGKHHSKLLESARAGGEPFVFWQRRGRSGFRSSPRIRRSKSASRPSIPAFSLRRINPRRLSSPAFADAGAGQQGLHRRTHCLTACLRETSQSAICTGLCLCTPCCWTSGRTCRKPTRRICRRGVPARGNAGFVRAAQ